MSDSQIYLQPIELSLLNEYYKDFEMDPDIYMDMSLFHEYQYSAEKVEAYYNKLKSQKDRVDFLIMLNEKPIGEISLKHIDNSARRCEISVHLQNDRVKNKGYGSQAERLIIEYAFNKIGIKEILANCVLKNTRSQHILEKVGFKETGKDGTFIYYKFTR